MIHETFLPRLFLRKTKTFSPVIGALSTIPVSKARLGFLNLVMLDQEKYSSSTRGSAELIQAMTGGDGSSNSNHLRTLSEEQRDRKEAWDVA